FEYHAPRTVEEAVGLLGELGDEAKVIAGGQSLVPMLALRLAVFGHLVDVGRIEEMRDVSRRNGTLVVGGGTREVVLEHARVDAADFFTGVWTTSLEPDELLVAARFPVWSGRCGFAVEEVARRHGDFALAGAVAGVQLADDGTVARAAIGLFGMGSTPVRARSAERAVVGSDAAA